LLERVPGPAGETNGDRKHDHLRIALNEDIDFHGLTTGLEEYSFVHQALPEVDRDRIDSSVTMFKKKLSAPLLISAMVGGVPSALRINRDLAAAAQSLGIAMGLGSARRALEDPGVAQSYKVRDVAPDILLFANLGAVQLNYGRGVDDCSRVIEMSQADALVLHLNPLQEALQPEGNTDFSGLLAKIEEVCRGLAVPVIVKEVGWGISEDLARKMCDAGVSAIDTAGAGGTSWAEVERLRAKSRRVNRIASTFSMWGIRTADSVLMVRRGAPALPLIASGGVRTGLDVAIAIALGADIAGLAAPLVKAANVSEEVVIEELGDIVAELRLAMFCAGAGDLPSLKAVPLVKRPKG